MKIRNYAVFSTIIRSNVAAVGFLCIGAAALAQPTWQTVAIPELPAGSSLGSVWARTRTEAYVWAAQNAGANYNAQLYRWNGLQWYQVLDVPGDYGRSVYGVGAGEVFAASSTNVWRSTDNGQNWTVQSLPALPGGSFTLDKLTGTPNNVQINAEGAYGYILRFDGTSWQVAYADQSGNTPYTLSVFAPNEGYFVTCWGWGKWDGSSWAFHGVQFDFCDVYDTWAMRDAGGGLHWWAVGNNNFSNGIRVWCFDTNSLSFGSKSGYCFGDGNASDIGGADAIWASSPDDVYVGGSLAASSGGQRAGRLYHYDGTNWSQVTVIGAIDPVAQNGIAGTARDDVWVSGGSTLLHYAQPPPTLAIQLYAGLTISGQIGATYQIQYSPSLNSPSSWVTLTNLTLPSSPYLFFDATSGGRPAGFYRALVQ